jgi:hypothetical protein
MAASKRGEFEFDAIEIDERRRARPTVEGGSSA